MFLNGNDFCAFGTLVLVLCFTSAQYKRSAHTNQEQKTRSAIWRHEEPDPSHILMEAS